MTRYKSFNRPPHVPIKRTEAQVIDLILEQVKQNRTANALLLAIKALSKEQAVDFAVEILSNKYKIYRLGIKNLKEAILSYRQGNSDILNKYLDEQKSTKTFQFSPFTSACINIAIVEIAGFPANADLVAETIMNSLMSLPQETEDTEYISIHMKLISDILSFRFNNNTMKVLYGT